jgi:hypothetical protein
MRWEYPLLATLLLACGRISAPLVGRSGTAPGSTAAGTTTGGSNASSGSGVASSASGGSTGSSSTGAVGTTGTTSGGSSTGGPPPPACLWRGDICASADCTHTSDYLPCALNDGGLGTCVDGQCQSVDYQSDPENCGRNGVVCPPEKACHDGVCGNSDCSDGGGCPVGTVCDWYGCVATDCTLAHDDALCYTLTDAGPTYAGFCCGGVCRLSDATHCGGCTIACSPGDVCYFDQCVLGASCVTGNNGDVCALQGADAGNCCDGTCSDVTSDPLNCGWCDNACPMGSTCGARFEQVATCSGLCFSDTDCPSGYGCSNTASYCPPDYGCYFPPPDAGGTCTLSQCTSAADGLNCLSDAGDICCGGECIDVSLNPAHCGSCATACGSGQFCSQGLCFALQDCNNAGAYASCALGDGGVGTCCGGACVDTSLDPSHCTNCDWSCPLEAVACSGSSTTGWRCVDDGGNAVECVSDQDCAAGTRCAIYYGGYCLPQSCDGGAVDCAWPIDGGADYGWCCNGECLSVYVYQDAGCTVLPLRSCSTAVYENQSCDFGPGLSGSCCGAQCTAPATDPSNCGSCGVSCGGECSFGRCSDPAVPPCLQTCELGTICAQGVCVDSTCSNPNVPYCLAQDGALGACCGGLACADLSTDPSYCGSCDIACPAGQACQAGFCNGITSCGPGHVNSYCNLDAGLSFLCCPGFGCIDTSSDPQNCGLCANPCDAGQVCEGGTCN